MKGGKVLVSSGLPRDSFPNLTPPASGKVEFLGCFSFLKLSKTTKEPISLCKPILMVDSEAAAAVPQETTTLEEVAVATQ